MNIRRASESDALRLAAIESLQPASAGWGEKGFAEEISCSASQIWCYEQGEIQGFVCLRAAAGQAEILNVAVHPSACRKGIGLALFSYVLNALKVQGVQDVTLEVNSKNFPAICLYEKVGFREVGRREKFYHQTDDALIMGKRL